MRSVRSYHLSLGSNIEPEANLREAIRRLREFGEVRGISSVWESQAVGSGGPNFLNVCMEFAADVAETELKRTTVEVIEADLGRIRTRDKNAPRTIDIDIIMDGEKALNLDRWAHAFVLLPMAELRPDMPDPVSGRPLSEVADEARASTWIRRRPDVVKGFEPAA